MQMHSAWGLPPPRASRMMRKRGKGVLCLLIRFSAIVTKIPEDGFEEVEGANAGNGGNYRWEYRLQTSIFYNLPKIYVL